MMARPIQRAEKPPVPGAIRTYKLAPAAHADPVAWVDGLLRRRGWTPLEEGRQIEPTHYAPYVYIVTWAIPPTRTPQEVSE